MFRSSSKSLKRRLSGTGNLPLQLNAEELLPRHIVPLSTMLQYHRITNVGGSEKHKGLSPLKLDEAASSTLPDADIHLPVAFEIARTKNLKKAVDYLIACDFLTPSPRDVSAFLRLHRGQLNPAALGVFLAEGGTGGGEIEYWNQIRFNYFRPISFVGMNVEQG